MKKQLLIILTIFMVLITLVSCNKSTIDNSDVSTTAITTVAATTIGKEIEVDPVPPSVDDFDKKILIHLLKDGKHNKSQLKR